MIDPKALTEKILEHVEDYQNLDIGWCKAMVDGVESLLREALEEASGAHSPIANARVSNAIYYATLTAYEECVKICNEHDCAEDCKSTIAEKIRLRKSEVMGK